MHNNQINFGQCLCFGTINLYCCRFVNKVVVPSYPMSGGSIQKKMTPMDLPPENITLVAINHPKIPDLPIKNPLGFEILYMCYLLSALFGQMLFIYKVCVYTFVVLHSANLISTLLIQYMHC